MQGFFAIGNLTKDPELKTTPSGKSVCKFTIAVNEIKTKDNDNPRVDYFPIVAWDNVAENAAKYLRKGKKVAIKGKWRSGRYEKDGHTYYNYWIEPDKYGGLTFLSSKENDNDQPAEQTSYLHAQADAEAGFVAVSTDELPF